MVKRTKKKTFFFKKSGKFIDIGRVDPNAIDMLPKSVFKEFFGGYDEIQAKNIDKALSKASMGKEVTTIAKGRVVRIEDMM